LLKQLVAATNLQIWANITPARSQYRLNLALKQLLYDLLRLVKPLPGIVNILSPFPKLKSYVLRQNRPTTAQPIDPAITNRAFSAVFGLAMYQKLADSKVTLNNHIDIATISASNMRLYEATGIGTCLLTDWKPDLEQLFEPDREVVTYKSAAEAIEKVNLFAQP
jgi:spore maturation protein CgeB